MQCERLLHLTKTWYLNVKDETMAPARMISFMEEHAASCDICRADPDLKDEIAKITEMILPESKIPKAIRQQQEEEAAAAAEEEEETDDEEDDLTGDEDEEEEPGLEEDE